MTTRFVLFGSSQIGVDVLRTLGGDDACTLEHVFTYDLPLDAIYGFEPVADVARGMGVPVTQKRSPDAVLAEMADLRPDYIISAYYRQILPSRVLRRARVDALNIHPSDLPCYRGPTPTGWALVHGERQVGITLHRMDSKVDSGDVLARSQVPIEGTDTGFSLHKKAMTEGARLFERSLPALLQRTYEAQPQEGIGSYYGPISNLGHDVRWYEGTDLVARKIRCMAPPYGGMRAQLLNKTLLINAARKVEATDRPLQGPGRIVAVDGDRLTVSCADGYLELTEVEWMPSMHANERPAYLRPGNRFDI